MIPFGAIERVEVVSDGASAVYGSDAVAGVVNYIFKRPADGGEISARYTHTMYDQGAVDGWMGKTWDSGGILVAASYEGNTRVVRGEIPGLRQDLRDFGGADNRLVGTTFAAPGINGAIIQGNTVYGIPSNLNGRTPTTAEINALRSNPQLVDRSDLEDFQTARQRASVLLRLRQDVGPGEVTLTGMFNRRTNFGRGQGDGSFQSIAVAIPTTSPYYVPGLTGGGSQSIVYNFRLNNPDRDLNRNDFENTMNLMADYKVPLWGDFRLTASGVYGVSEGCAVCQPQANTILTSTIAGPATAALFNPYVTGPQASAEKIFGIFIQKGRQQILDFVPKIDGSLFSLPAGAVRIALGGEATQYNYRQHAIYSLNPTTTYQDFREAYNGRRVYSGFAEAFVPFFSSENAIPGFQSLDLSVAVRYDHYSDFGSTTNPKVGLTWAPVSDLSLRGSWGTSFRAPTLSETNFQASGNAVRSNIANGLNDPSIPITIASSGQTSILNSTWRFTQLQPETASIYSAGGDYTPSFIPGLKLGLTYYHVDYKDRIANLPNAANALRSPADFALYSPFFIRAPQPATCVNGSVNGNPGAPEYATYNQLYRPYLEAIGSYPPTTINDCQLQGILDASTRNLGRVVQSGLDFTLNYKQDIQFATLTLNGAFTKILDLKRNLLPGAPLVSALDVIGEQDSERGRFTAGLARGPVSGAVSANYVGGYLNNATPTVNGVKLPDQSVPSWTTFDLNLSFEPEAEQGALHGTRLALNVRNLTDKDAPVVLNGTQAVDLNYHDVLGRIWTIEISKAF
jgi:iron complex outermembrane receptor protein